MGALLQKHEERIGTTIIHWACHPESHHPASIVILKAYGNASFL
jgi:hypothetical protein